MNKANIYLPGSTGLTIKHNKPELRHNIEALTAQGALQHSKCMNYLQA